MLMKINKYKITFYNKIQKKLFFVLFRPKLNKYVIFKLSRIKFEVSSKYFQQNL